MITQARPPVAKALPTLNADRSVLRTLRPLWRNRLTLAGGLVVLTLIVIALAANFLAPDDPIGMNVADSLHGPSVHHWFGTDAYGRDVLSRVIYGSRISLWAGLVSVAGASAIGTLFGLLSGYFGGWIDIFISRIMDVLFSFPSLLLAIAIAAMLGPGINNAILAIIVVYSPLFARIARGSVLAERGKEYIEAARVAGGGHGRILRVHILPNIVAPLIIQASITVAFAILMEAYLSYLGLGTQPPTPSWGAMLNDATAILEVAPWTSVFPGLAIVLAVLGFSLLGDGLRDVLDPRSR